MSKSRDKIRSANRKRKVLIVDDELINRELLKLILEDEYEALTASNGKSALKVPHQYGESISLIMLDLLVPGMHGLEVIRHLKEDPSLHRIPIIVLTADSGAEVESLKEGAVDFIAKPYPEHEVIHARVRRTIELSEDREIIQSTERDELTGLYSREYFYRYCRQFDALTNAKSNHAHVDSVAEINTQIDMGNVQPFAVVVCDVNGLKEVNDAQGHHAGDRLIVEASGVICGAFRHSPVYRVSGDEFVVILRGRDYLQRTSLMALMRENNRRSRVSGGPMIACGASEWRSGEDTRFESVFDRANTAMYENKSALKDLW